MNIDENMMGKLQDMMQKGELNDILSQVPPEMIQNFSSMMSNNTSNDTNNNSNNDSGNNASGGFDFSKIDMNTLMKMKSVMDKMNSSDDSRSNLLKSLKPYLRDDRKGKVDQYTNLLNMAKIAEIFNNKDKENK